MAYQTNKQKLNKILKSLYKNSSSLRMGPSRWKNSVPGAVFSLDRSRTTGLMNISFESQQEAAVAIISVELNRK